MTKAIARWYDQVMITHGCVWDIETRRPVPVSDEGGTRRTETWAADGGWTLREIHLSEVTKAKGIAGNGNPPRECWNWRITKNGQHQGYVRGIKSLMGIMGDDFYTLRKVA